MRKLPQLFHIPNVDLLNIKKVGSFSKTAVTSILAHKILITFLIFISLGVGALIVSRNHFVSQIKTAKESSPSDNIGYVPVSEDATPIASESASVTDNDVLGTSTEETTYTPTYNPTSKPIPIYKPSPTSQPTSTPTLIVVSPSSTPSVSTPAPSNSSGARSCSSMGVSPGVPTAFYSQTSTPQTVGNTAVITIELKDCNDNITSVTDTLSITQTSGPGTTVNGSSPPISIETSNGKASFTVKSQTSGEAVYIVRETTKSFNVTDPNNKNPRVTFNISTPAQTATPKPSTPAPLSSPTPSSKPSNSPTSSATPTSTPTVSPTPTGSPKATPTSSPTISSSAN